MIIKKPSIYVYVNEPEAFLLREICSGIEEEGIFYEVIEKQSMDVNTLAFDAANHSMLGSGIGVVKKQACLQLKGLKKELPIFSIENPSVGEARRLGMNSARVLKKQPLKER